MGQVQCSRAGVALRRILLHSPGGEGDFGLALGKQDETGRIFYQNTTRTEGKGQNRTQNRTKQDAEWNSLPFGFFVSYLCNANG